MRKVILIDVDDVVCENHFLPLVNKFLKKNNKPVLKSLNGFDTPDFEKKVFETVEELQAFNDYYLAHDSYKGAKPIKGSVEALKELSENHDIYFVTACIHGEREREFARQFFDKFNWLLDTFPFIPPKNIVFINKKFLLKGDVMIDDRLKHLHGEFKTRILFSSFHNKNHTKQELDELNAVRANGWKDIVRIIHKS